MPVSKNHVAKTIMTANVKANTVDGFANSTPNSAILNAIEKSSIQSPDTQSPVSNSSMKSSPSTSGGGELDRIREIIFGQQTRKYEQIFDTIAKDIKGLQQEARCLNEQLLAQKQTHANQIQELNLQFAQKLKTLEEQQQIKYAEIDEKQNQDIQELQGIVSRIQDELSTEIRQTSERLGIEKTDRAVLSELLIDLGKNLQTD